MKKKIGLYAILACLTTLFTMMMSPVSAKADNEVHVSSWSTLSYQLSQKTESTIILDKSIIMDDMEEEGLVDAGMGYPGGLLVRGTHTLDLRGHDIQASMKYSEDTYQQEIFLFLVPENASLTMKDSVGEGLVRMHSPIRDVLTDRAERSVFLVSGNLNIESGTYIAGRSKSTYSAADAKTATKMVGGTVVDAVNNATVNISGGRFENYMAPSDTILGVKYGRSSEYALISARGKATVTIYDGYFVSHNGAAMFDIGASDYSTLFISKGEFVLDYWDKVYELISGVSYRNVITNGETGEYNLQANYFDLGKSVVELSIQKTGISNTYTATSDYLRINELDQEYHRKVKTLKVIPLEETGASVNIEKMYLTGSGMETQEGCATVRRDAYPMIHMDESEFLRYTDGSSSVSYNWSIKRPGDEGYLMIKGYTYTDGLGFAYLPAETLKLADGSTYNFMEDALDNDTVTLACVATEKNGEEVYYHKGYFELTMENYMERSVIEKLNVTSNIITYLDEKGYLKKGTQVEDITLGIEEAASSLVSTRLSVINTVYDSVDQYVEEWGYYEFALSIVPNTNRKITEDTEFVVPEWMTNYIISDSGKTDRSYNLTVYLESSHPEFISDVALLPKNLSLDTGRMNAGETLLPFATDGSEKYLIYDQIWMMNGEEVEMGSTIPSNSVCQVTVTLKAAQGYLFDPKAVYKIGNLTCIAKVSEDYKSVELTNASFIFTGCAHRADRYTIDGERCYKVCVDCGEIYDNHKHFFRTSTTELTTRYICMYCKTSRLYNVNGMAIAKIVVDVPTTTLGTEAQAPVIDKNYDDYATVTSYQWYRGEMTDANQFSGKFTSGSQYRLKVTVKPKQGYCFDSEKTLVNCTTTAKDSTFGSYETNYQSYNTKTGEITVVFLYADAYETGKLPVTLPDISTGKTFGEVVNALSASVTEVTSGGILGTTIAIYKNGTQVASATKALGMVSFSKDFAGTASTTFEQGGAYTLKIKFGLLGCEVPAENVTVQKDAYGLANYFVTGANDGPELTANYYVGDGKVTSICIVGLDPQKNGPNNGTVVGDFEIIDTQWECDGSVAEHFSCGSKSNRLTVELKYVGNGVVSKDATVTVNGQQAVIDEINAGKYYCKIVCDYEGEHTRGNVEKANVVEGTSTTAGSYDLVTYCGVCGNPMESKHYETSKKYSITITTDGRGTVTADKSSAITGEVVELTVKPKTGYYLSGWQVIEGNISVGEDCFCMGSANVVLKAVFQAQGAVVTKQPESVAVEEGKTAKFTVATDYAGSVTYQWQKSIDGGVNWSKSTSTGATTDTLTLTAKVSFKGYKFRCKITTGTGAVTYSYAATLSVIAKAPVITKQPVDVCIDVDDSASFSVEATGYKLSYRWYKSYDGGNTWGLSYSTGASTQDMYLVGKVSFNGLMFKCRVTNGDGVYTDSEPVTLLVGENPIVIIQQPENKIAKLGTSVSFPVKAVGKNLQYQWKKYIASSDSFEPIKVKSATTETLTFTTATSHNGMRIICEITDADGNKVTTNEVMLAVLTDTSDEDKKIQPQNRAVAVGETVTFTASAGTTGYTYQWEKSTDGGTTWVNSGSTGAKTETITMVAKISFNGLQFRCKMTAKNGTVIYSNPATLTVTAATADGPVIKSQPADVTAATMTNVSFSVEAKGDGLTYQWMKSTNGGTTWVNSGSTGAKTATLSMSTRVSYNGMKLKCVVTDQNGKSVTSKVVTLTVK